MKNMGLIFALTGLLGCVTQPKANMIYAKNDQAVTKSMWKNIAPHEVAQFPTDSVSPSSYQVYQVDQAALQHFFDNFNAQKQNLLELPFDTTRLLFLLEETNVMSGELQKKYGNLKSYKASQAGISSSSGRINWDGKDMQASLSVNGKQYYIEPIKGTAYYRMFLKSSLPPRRIN